jgi:hypothetical protein
VEWAARTTLTLKTTPTARMKWDSPIIPRVLAKGPTLRPLRPLLQHRPLPQPLGALARDWHQVYRHHLVSAMVDVPHRSLFSIHYIWCSLRLVLQHAAFEFGSVVSGRFHAVLFMFIRSCSYLHYGGPNVYFLDLLFPSVAETRLKCEHSQAMQVRLL